jgi:hypothetical protein
MARALYARYIETKKVYSIKKLRCKASVIYCSLVFNASSGVVFTET